MARKYYNDNYSVLGIEKGEMLKSSQKKAPEDEKIFVRYDEGAKRYSMCRNSFMRLAADAGAVYKINKISLVNIKICTAEGPCGKGPADIATVEICPLVISSPG